MEENGPVIRFFKAHPDVPMIGQGSSSALGTIPAVAFQYCEPLRTASAFGWYVFPPKPMSLTFDGHSVFIFENDEWVLVKSNRFEDGFPDHWNAHAPELFQNREPPFVSTLPNPGFLQIFSGYFIESRPGWSVMIKPPSNIPRGSVDFFEGIVETDEFRPAPLFINLRLNETGKEIYFDQNWPLFQVLPIRRECYTGNAGMAEIVERLDDPDAKFDWTGVEKTLHVFDDPRASHRTGAYAAATRKRKKSGPNSSET